jgi:uncharacterized membrane protein
MCAGDGGPHLNQAIRIPRDVTDRRDLGAALLLGLGGGLRSFAPPVALAIHDRGPLAGPGRFIVFGAAAGELIADKDPRMPSRWGRRGLSFRLVFSSRGGAVLALSYTLVLTATRGLSKG